MIHIVSDSTSDLSLELIQKYDIKILPLFVHLGDDEYLDGVNITPDEIFLWADKNRTTPKTSAISVESAEKLFSELTQKGDEVIAFCISEQMSSTGSAMRIAAASIEKEESIHVVDSESLSTGIGLLIVEAAKMAKDGASSKEILSRIDYLKPYVRASFVVDTLIYLHRGGRCSGVAAIAGSALKLHPLIKVENGKMIPGKKYRGRINTVIAEYAKDLEPALLNAKKDIVFITHSGCDIQAVDGVRKYLESLKYFDEIHETRAGSVISSHCGPGTLGVLFISNN